MMMDRESLSEWAKDKPLSILQLDPADRAVLRIAGEWTLQINKYVIFIWVVYVACSIVVSNVISHIFEQISLKKFMNYRNKSQNISSRKLKEATWPESIDVVR